ncbi:MAG: hypothetical protein RBS01_01670 [Candidatus Dojkabacteria bacterium]|jgi:hypothetical protein|nr:hypothetical protein [Candidatus Dojkabacteria bacterium]
MDLNKPISEAISSVEPTPVESTLPPTPPQGRSKGFIIIVSILMVLILGMGGYYVYTEYFAPKEVEQEQEDENTELDVTEYTDIKLMSYDGLEVSISEGAEDEESKLVKGIVEYRKVGYALENMKIVNKKVITDDEILQDYLEVVEVIKGKDIEAEWLLTGAEPWVLTTETKGTPNYTPLILVEGFEYPNTDYSFAVLSLAHGHEYATADSTSANFNIHIFAIKGDNLIRLESILGNLIKDIGLSEESSTKCSEMTKEYTSTDENYLTYNVECLMGVFDTGTYDEKLLGLADTLAEKFAIQGSRVDEVEMTLGGGTTLIVKLENSMADDTGFVKVEDTDYLMWEDNGNNYGSTSYMLNYFKDKDEMGKFFAQSTIAPVLEDTVIKGITYQYVVKEDGAEDSQRPNGMGLAYIWEPKVKVKEYEASRIVSYYNPSLSSDLVEESNITTYAVLNLSEILEDVEGYLVFRGFASIGSEIDYTEVLNQMSVFEISKK